MIQPYLPLLLVVLPVLVGWNVTTMMSGGGTSTEPPSFGPGDLNVPASRICQSTDDVNCDGTWNSGYWWTAPTIPDTSAWTETPIDCSGGGDVECSYSEIQGCIDAADGTGDVCIVPLTGDGTHSIDGSTLHVNESNTVLRCADGVTLDVNEGLYGSCSHGGGGGGTSLCVGAGSLGATTTWTANFSKGNTVIEVANGDSATFAADEYIILRANLAANGCTSLWNDDIDDSQREHQSQHLTQIDSINPNGAGPDLITIDSPLRYDYDDCTEGKLIEKWTPTEHVGLENCIIQGPTDALNGDFNQAVNLTGVNPWMIGNHVTSFYNCGIGMLDAKEAVVQYNKVTSEEAAGQEDTCGAIFVERSSDFLVENNYWANAQQQLEAKGGPDGGVFGYNYALKGTSGNGTKAIFIHGYYPREILAEGNDTEGAWNSDDVWGSNGHSVLYRNRFRDYSGNDIGHSGISPQDASASIPSSFSATVIANATPWIIGGLSFCDQTNPSQCGDFDDVSDTIRDAWLEYNFCDGGLRSGTDCIQLSPETDTSCGDSGGAGTCTYDGPEQTWDRNQMNVAVADLSPTGWDSPTIPVSLYRDSKPDWWCSEAATCAWSTAGIGALGDNFGGTLCKLPAEILKDGTDCTCENDMQCTIDPTP